MLEIFNNLFYWDENQFKITRLIFINWEKNEILNDSTIHIYVFHVFHGLDLYLLQTTERINSFKDYIKLWAII